MNKIEITVDVITKETSITEVPFTEQELAYSAQINAEIEAQQVEKAQVTATPTSSSLRKLEILLPGQDHNSLISLSLFYKAFQLFAPTIVHLLLILIILMHMVLVFTDLYMIPGIRVRTRRIAR